MKRPCGSRVSHVHISYIERSLHNSKCEKGRAGEAVGASNEGVAIAKPGYLARVSLTILLIITFKSSCFGVNSEAMTLK